MTRLIRLFLGVLVPAFMLAGVASLPATAQDKAKGAKAAPAAKAEKGKPIFKELVDNDKVRAFEVRYRPGDVGPSNVRPARIIRALTAGTFTLIFPDGKTEKRAYKAGEVKYFNADSAEYKLKNEGKSDFVVYAVFLKEPKK